MTNKSPEQHLGVGLMRLGKAFFALGFVVLIIFFMLPDNESKSLEDTTTASSISEADSIASAAEKCYAKGNLNDGCVSQVLKEEATQEKIATKQSKQTDNSNTYDPDKEYGIKDTIGKDGIRATLWSVEHETRYGINDVFIDIDTIIEDPNKKPSATSNFIYGQWFTTIWHNGTYVVPNSFCTQSVNSIADNAREKFRSHACIQMEQITEDFDRGYISELYYGKDVYLIYTLLSTTVEIRKGSLVNASIGEIKEVPNTFVFKFAFPKGT